VVVAYKIVVLGSNCAILYATNFPTMHHCQNRHLFPVAYISVELGRVTAFLYATNLCARQVESEKRETRLDSLRAESSFKNQARRSNSIESSTTLSSTNRVEPTLRLDSSSQLGSKLDSARLGAMSVHNRWIVPYNNPYLIIA